MPHMPVWYQEGLVLLLVIGPPSGRAVLVLKNPRFSEEHAQRYSALVEAGREEELLPSLQALDPRIRRLELLYPANKPMLYVDIGSDQLVPLTYMGEGLGYVLYLQLAIMTANNGTVLIDEFENGLHYVALVDAWKAVGIAARQSSVQVFATTHSWECVLAAHRAFAESDEDDFRLHRLERRDGEVVCAHVRPRATGHCYRIQLRGALVARSARDGATQVKIELPKMLLVEGESDRRFFETLLGRLFSTETIQVERYGGKFALREFLRLLQISPRLPNGRLYRRHTRRG